MKNSAVIKSDGINVYVTSSVKSNSFGKWLVTIFTSLLACILFFLFASVDPEEAGPVLVPFFLGSLAFYYFILRYTLWNWFGKEHLIINAKTISYKFDYGWFNTNLKTLSVNRLGISNEFVQHASGVDFGRIFFYNYNPENNLPELLHQTSILIPEQTILEITEAVAKIFEDEYFEERGFLPYHLN